MKPRTKMQFRVVELSELLSPISQEQIEYAKSKYVEHIGFRTKSFIYCMDCGEKIIREDGPYFVCPHCGAKLKVKDTRDRTLKQEAYFSIIDVVQEFQVCRYLSIYVLSAVGQKRICNISEFCQQWILPNGKYVIYSRRHNYSWYYNTFSGNFEIRKNNDNRYWRTNGYDINPGFIYKNPKILPEFKRYGISSNFHDCSPLSLFSNIANDNRVESILKMKQGSILYLYLSGKQKSVSDYWHSIKICNRNGYIVKDASMWIDYLELLGYFNMDTHNAKFVCPKDLKKQHDILLARKEKKEKERRKKERRERLVREAIERKEDMLAFYQLKSKFFGMQIKGSGIIIHPLESITQFYKEGNTMNHCVFSMKYYSKPDSLILSATNLKGERLETIEVNLKTFKVIQSRAICNGQSDKHDDIVSLVTKNMRLIKQRMAS